MSVPFTLKKPDGGVVPHLNVDGASAAAAFYGHAFAAEELSRIPAPDGEKLMYCLLHINNGMLILSDCFPEAGHALQPSHSYTMHLQVGDAAAWWQRAIDAGAEIVVPLAPTFWGDIYGKLKDPFGITWSLGSAAPANS